MPDDATPEVEPTEICEDGPAKVVPMRSTDPDDGFGFLETMRDHGWRVKHKHFHPTSENPEVLVVFLAKT